ncbi:hypothetical protein [Streptosporangium sp. NPDC051022]|uniref:hypothetical protein n=1 Tax=Streptosporangium sp. NPDC051022 TaxID=3155752 RepID=UPI003418510E
MSRRASDFPDEQAWPPGRGGASSGDESDHDSDWHPERLPTFNWRKVILFGAFSTIIGAAAIWLIRENGLESQTLVADPSPQLSGPTWSTGAPPFPFATANSASAVPDDEKPSPAISEAPVSKAPVPPVSKAPVSEAPIPSVSKAPGRASDDKGKTAPPPPPEPVPTQKTRVETTSQPSADPSAPGASQLTIRQAYRIHGHYQRSLSAAQAALDQAAMGKLEGGLAVEMTRASFKTARMEGEQVSSGIWPNPQVWVPRHVEGTPDWFVAVSYEPGIARVMDLMSSTPAGWRLTASGADTRATPGSFPRIATDAEGYAASLPENATGLVATPREVATAHLTSLESAKPDPRFEDGPWTSETVQFWQHERAQLEDAGWILSLSYRPEGPVRALRTADGGALLWYAARSTDSRLAERKGAKVSLKGPAAVRTGHKAFAHSASATYGRIYVTYIPPAGSSEPVRVLGEWSEVLESHGD